MATELIAKSMLHYHDQAFATNWDANIYRGCEHNCKYCFAQYSHKYLKNNTKDPESNDFFDEIFIKINADEILNKELSKKKWRKFPVNVCGISDCYQPQEANYKIMPKVIKSFIKNRNPLAIMTKSTLILRDIELIKELNDITEVSIAVSVSTLDETKRKIIEPNTAPTIERMKMLKQFSEIGCKTSVGFMPIIPYISDDDKNLDEIFRLTKEYNLGSIMAYPLHLRGQTKNTFFSFLSKEIPNLLVKFANLYKNGSVSKEYKAKLFEKIQNLRNKYQLHSSYKPSKPIDKNEDYKVNGETWTQLSLFD